MRVRAILKAIRAYRRTFGRWPNLFAPRTFNEKMLIAKLFWRSRRMVELADKVRAKEIVARELGSEWIIPTLYNGPWLPSAEQRNWPMPYVVKANNGSGGHGFVRRSADADWQQIEPRLRKSLKGRHGNEWVYTAIPPQVLVEPMIGEGLSDLPDYKIFVFGGRARFIRVHTDRFTDHKAAYADLDWKLQPFMIERVKAAEQLPPRPASLDRMLQAAEKLAVGFPVVRVDFYEVDGLPKFGEVTFYSDGGLKPFVPDSYDLVLGQMWQPGRPTA